MFYTNNVFVFVPKREEKNGEYYKDYKKMATIETWKYLKIPNRIYEKYITNLQLKIISQ